MTIIILFSAILILLTWHNSFTLFFIIGQNYIVVCAKWNTLFDKNDKCQIHLQFEWFLCNLFLRTLHGISE